MRFASAVRSVAPPVLLLFALPLPVQSQRGRDTGAATGTVRDAVTGEVIVRARISVHESGRKVETNREGVYRIEDLPEGDVLVRVQADGYVHIVEKILVNGGWTTGVDFELEPMVAMLDALLVEAGLGSSRSRARSGSGTVDPSSDRDALESISGVPGVQVLRPGGGAGHGGRILIRGLSSIALSNDPVVYLDGVRVDLARPIAGEQARGGGTWSNGLDFIDPEMIERIEILRGPATAARYGMEAGSGVILIFTKRGGSG